MNTINILFAVSMLLCLALAVAGIRYGRTLLVSPNKAAATIFTSAAFFSVTVVVVLFLVFTDCTSLICYMLSCLVLALSTFTGFMGISYRV
jgi:hypothetical protein